MNNGPRIYRIVEHFEENATCRTMRFDDAMTAQPGQFLMIWIPGEDELPMSVSYIGDRFGITYKIVGDGTKRLASLGKGDMVGVRGPYGRGFGAKCERPLIVAGGTGMACLAPLIEDLATQCEQLDVVLGARTGSELLMLSRAEGAGARVHIVTDDGSVGAKGLATDMVARLIEDRRSDHLYACGPEKMLAKLVALAKEATLPLEASIERYMKCGIGICDSCAIDGKHVCRDGPVFSGEELSSFTDLGRTKLSPSGRRVSID